MRARGHSPTAVDAAASRVPARPVQVHGLLRLQATAGNAVVQRLLLQRQGAAEDEYRSAVDRSDWRTAIAYLVTQPAAEMKGLAESLILGQVEAMLGAVGADQHTVRGVLLERGFGITKGGNWEKAARFVSVLDELKLLAKGARTSSGGGDERLLKAIRDKLRIDPGQLFGELKVTMTPKNGSLDPKMPYFMTTNIIFLPDPDIVDATTIGFVQTVSMLRTNETNTIDSVDNRKFMSGRLNKEGQGVDREPKFTSGWYGEQNDGTYKPKNEFGAATAGVILGKIAGGKAEPAAWLTDMPDGTEPATYSYETAIVAKDGPDSAKGDKAGLAYAVVKWWFTADADRKIVAHDFAITNKPPSASFGVAVAAWNKQVDTKSGGEGQQRLPVQRQSLPVVSAIQRDPSNDEA